MISHLVWSENPGAGHYGVFSVAAVCMALLYAIGYSAMLGFILSISDNSEKDLILGSVASICAISASLTAILGGYLNLLSNVVFLLCYY